MELHDLFVSYSHADDEAPYGETYGWVTTFVNELRKILRRKLGGQGANVWMDHLLASNEKVSETLLEKIRASKTLVLFLSSGYMKSTWCEREIGLFLEQNSEHKSKENVFIVELDATPRNVWPRRLKELTPLSLYEKTPGKNVTELLGYPRPPQDSDSAYWKRLNELAHLISEHLGWIAQQQPSYIATPFNAGGGSVEKSTHTVWIAQPTEDLFEKWESIAAAVRQRGGIVHPVGRATYPIQTLDDFKEAALSDIREADMLVQLLSSPYENYLAETKQLPLLQASLAKLHCLENPSVHFLQWRSPETTLDSIDDLSYRGLLQGTISSGFEQFRQQVLDVFDSLSVRATKDPEVSKGDSKSLSLCITAGPKDEDLSRRVSDIVLQLGHAALAAPPGPEPGQLPAEYRSQFEELLDGVDGVILIHGGEHSIWVQSRYAQVRKVLAQRSRGIWGALLDGPPPGKPVAQYGGPDLVRLNCRDGVRREPIERFIDTLRREAVHAV